MKSVLLSIKPKWCELIANRRKTIEVRRTRPKIETPFKCYIYCTQQKIPGEILLTYDKKVVGRNKGFREEGDIPLSGKVIGEFVCDSIISRCESANADLSEQYGCIKREKLFEYAKGKELFGWHISDIIIYDKPKELDYFRKPFECHRGIQKDGCVGCWDCEIKRPPQSWCYVDENHDH